MSIENTEKIETIKAPSEKKARAEKAPKAEKAVLVESAPKAKKAEKAASAKNSIDAPKIKITLVKSPAGCLEKQQKTVKALGLKKIRSEKIHLDSPAVRGMIFLVKHLVKVENI